MPIRNVGTLLENIVLAEAARLLIGQATDSCRLEFVNAFAMPPLTQWTGTDDSPQHPHDYNFSPDILSGLAGSDQELTPGGYPNLLRRCLRHSGQGPNGAVLVGMLAALAGVETKLWLNDRPDADPDAHYPNAITELRGLPGLVGTLLSTKADRLDVEVCDTEYPDSLADMRETVAAWNAIAGRKVRLGFLDPMKYSVENPEPNYTSSEDHQRWLKQLAMGNPETVVSVHFTWSQNGPVLSHELYMMSRDRVKARFPVSLEFRHSGYAVVVLVRADLNAARGMAASLETAVASAWLDWHTIVGRAPSPLASTLRVQLFS